MVWLHVVALTHVPWRTRSFVHLVLLLQAELRLLPTRQCRSSAYGSADPPPPPLPGHPSPVAACREASWAPRAIPRVCWITPFSLLVTCTVCLRTSTSCLSSFYLYGRLEPKQKWQNSPIYKLSFLSVFFPPFLVGRLGWGRESGGRNGTFFELLQTSLTTACKINICMKFFFCRRRVWLVASALTGSLHVYELVICNMMPFRRWKQVTRRLPPAVRTLLALGFIRYRIQADIGAGNVEVG